MNNKRSILKSIGIVVAVSLIYYCTYLLSGNVFADSNRTFRKIVPMSEAQENAKYKAGSSVYWYKRDKGSIKLYQKTSSGKKKILINKSNKSIKVKSMGPMPVSKYAYTSVFSDGKNLIYGEFNRQEKTVTIKKKNLGTKKEKSLKTYHNDYFESYSGISCFSVKGVYNNICVFDMQRQNSSKWDRYRINIKNGKILDKKQIKSGYSDYAFDGRYLYETERIYDMKTNKYIKYPKKIRKKLDKVMIGEDGVYAITSSNDVIYSVYKINGNSITDKICSIDVDSGLYNFKIKKITQSSIYYEARQYKKKGVKHLCYEYSRSENGFKELKEKNYNKKVSVLYK